MSPTQESDGALTTTQDMKLCEADGRVGDLLVDGRCGPAVLGFVRSTYVGQAVPPVEENLDSGDEEEEAAEANEEEAEGVEGRAE